jgi:acetyltransferase EpsM
MSAEVNGKLVIWGASGHALVVADIIRLGAEYRIVGMLDDLRPERAGSEFGGCRIIGGREQLGRLRDEGVDVCILGFGNCAARLALSEVVRSYGFRLATAIHPRATVASGVQVGAGSVIVDGSVVNPAAVIGENVIINTCASVDHECIIADGVHIAPGAHLAARVEVGRGSWVGIGSVVKEGVRIGAGSMVGAGSVVLRDIPEGVLAYGSPAKVIRPIIPNQ